MQRQVVRLAHTVIETRRFALSKGKAVLEVRPKVPWDKGEAVRWLMARMGAGHPPASTLAVYIGDDATDEDAFRAVRTTGLGIVVGHDRPVSAAHYALASVEQTTQFLAVLSGLIWPRPQL